MLKSTSPAHYLWFWLCCHLKLGRRHCILNDRQNAIELLMFVALEIHLSRRKLVHFFRIMIGVYSEYLLAGDCVRAFCLDCFDSKQRKREHREMHAHTHTQNGKSSWYCGWFYFECLLCLTDTWSEMCLLLNNLVDQFILQRFSRFISFGSEWWKWQKM